MPAALARNQYYSLIKTFAESLKYCIKLKNSSNFILLTSLLCSSFTLKRINHLLAPHNCCISQYSWHRSQLHKDCQGSGILEKKEFKRSNAMTSLSSIQEAVRFIKSSDFFKPIAHGTHFARLSDGSRVRLSNRIRKKSKKHIWQAYKEYQSPEKKVARDTLYTIVDTIGTNNDKLLAALDSYSIKYGDNNFSRIKDFIRMITIERSEIEEE